MALDRRKSALVIVVVCVLFAGFAFSLNTAKAATAISITGIETYDSEGNVKTTTDGDNDPFTVGDYIYISWSQKLGTATVDVSATNPSGNPVSIYKVPVQLDIPIPGTTPQSTSWTNQGNTAKLCLVIYATASGVYQIKVDGTGGATMTLSVTVNAPPPALPEYPIGSILATVAGFAAFGLVAVVKLRSTKKLSPI